MLFEKIGEVLVGMVLVAILTPCAIAGIVLFNVIKGTIITIVLFMMVGPGATILYLLVHGIQVDPRYLVSLVGAGVFVSMPVFKVFDRFIDMMINLKIY